MFLFLLQSNRREGRLIRRNGGEGTNCPDFEPKITIIGVVVVVIVDAERNRCSFQLIPQLIMTTLLEDGTISMIVSFVFCGRKSN